MWNAGLDEGQAGINITRRNISNLRYIDDTTLMAESEEELKSLLMRVREENEKAVLELNILGREVIGRFKREVTHTLLLASLVAQPVKNLPVVQETRVQSLGWEDPMEKEMAIHSSTIAWKIPWTEELGRLQSMGPQRVGHNWATSLSLSPLF